MDGCVLCWVELVHRLAGVRSALQDQMTAIKEQMADINGLSHESGGSATGEDAAWGLSPREWADYTLSVSCVLCGQHVVARSLLEPNRGWQCGGPAWCPGS